MLEDSAEICIGKKYEVSLIELNVVNPIQEQMPCNIFYNFGESNFIANELEYNCDLCITREFFGKSYVSEPRKQRRYVQWILENPIKITSSRRGSKRLPRINR